MIINNNKEVDIEKMLKHLMILISQEYFRKINIMMTSIKKRIKAIILNSKNNSKDKIIKVIRTINLKCYKSLIEMVVIMKEMRKN